MSLSLECPHEPKISKKYRVMNNEMYEVLVCKNCRNDPDLKDFEEITLWEFSYFFEIMQNTKSWY